MLFSHTLTMRVGDVDSVTDGVYDTSSKDSWSKDVLVDMTYSLIIT